MEGPETAPVAFLNRRQCGHWYRRTILFYQEETGGCWLPTSQAAPRFQCECQQVRGWAVEGGDAPLIHHGAIEIPGLANVQQSG
jgi:hypothetical protein